MTTRTLLPTVLLVLAACSSSPTTDRPGSPDRPEVPRPEGVEPDGLVEMRDSLGAQRSEARAMDNALNLNPTSASPQSDKSLLETIVSPAADAMHFVRTILFGEPIPAGATR